ncbi:hypothetical protein GCK72_003459 [Caenorhabditis remanei]|uniref:C-type lectin domain-containing protein n=1 Tax=Caenorhabditis remanei TaxID=31234 RepID=A0A6A5HYY3_CAERE|nr:hypothetical protein GCK72_003459 [Caenorhabditis remanei]KAF1771632.1 hypothetical protein GCK72_003459 [Caenorhabditis remanei]
MKPFLLFLLLGITVVSGIIRLDGDGGGGDWDYGGGGGGGGGHHPSHSSSSSEEHGHGGHGHHGPRPPRPRPPRPARCPSDWMTFDRTAGTWCVKVFSGTTTGYNAQSMCQAQGAVLTGVQDANERIQIANAARILNNVIGGLNNAWLGGKRRAQCPNKPSCAPLDTFEWTDGHTTGTDGFWWPGPQPDAYWDANWGIQTCLSMIVSAADGKTGILGYPHGSMDDEHCQATRNLYACGKEPS